MFYALRPNCFGFGYNCDFTEVLNPVKADFASEQSAFFAEYKILNLFDFERRCLIVFTQR
jgi:hypothetical protein